MADCELIVMFPFFAVWFNGTDICTPPTTFMYNPNGLSGFVITVMVLTIVFMVGLGGIFFYGTREPRNGDDEEDQTELGQTEHAVEIPYGPVIVHAPSTAKAESDNEQPAEIPVIQAPPTVQTPTLQVPPPVAHPQGGLYHPVVRHPVLQYPYVRYPREHDILNINIELMHLPPGYRTEVMSARYEV